MGIIASIALIICGVLAAATLIVKNNPNSKELIDKLVPYQGIIGVIVCIWGIWIIINSLLNISAFHIIPLLWLTILAIGLLSFALGFLLGFALISKYALAGSAEATAKGELLRAKIATYQIPLGLAGIVVGIWGLIATLR